MRFCTECLTVNGHHPNCPEAEDCTEPDEEEGTAHEMDIPQGAQQGLHPLLVQD